MTTFAARIPPRIQDKRQAAAVVESHGRPETVRNRLKSADVLGQRSTVGNEANVVQPHRRTLASSAGQRATAFVLATIATLVTLGFAGCSSAPKDLDLSLQKPSSGGTYRVAMVPPTQAPAINQLHSWTVKLAGPDGLPVRGARFTVDGGMPQHGHGLPTQPRVTRELAEGSYQLDGMKFSMTGWWELKLAIAGPLGEDRVTFNTVVGNPPVQR
ncbi:MAG TPA: FixH family protein [Rubrivivax sp.]|nr:FixH family protein [Rubrivivax sp.]